MACTSVNLSVGAIVNARLAHQDGLNLVVFRPGPWCHNERCGHTTTFPLRAAAMTTTYPARATPTLVQEADIELNAANFAWTETDDQRRPRAPLDAVLVHELGHVLGFEDVCLGDDGRRTADCSDEERASVMNPGSRKTALTAFDVARLCKAYPPAAASEPAAGTPWFLIVTGVLVLAGVAAFARYLLAKRRSSSAR